MIRTAAAAMAATAAAPTLSSASAAVGGNTLRVYRRLLGLARQMQPAEQRQKALAQIREGFRQHAREQDGERCVGIGVMCGWICVAWLRALWSAKCRRV